MKRRKGFSTSTKSSVDNRRLEAKGPDCESDEVDAPAFLVEGIKFSGLTVGSMIRLTVPVLPDLYLETITLVRGGPAGEVVGRLSKGTRKKLGSAKVTISAELYDFVLSEARASKLLITLEHAETRVTDIRFESV